MADAARSAKVTIGRGVDFLQPMIAGRRTATLYVYPPSGRPLPLERGWGEVRTGSDSSQAGRGANEVDSLTSSLYTARVHFWVHHTLWLPSWLDRGPSPGSAAPHRSAAARCL